MINVNHSDFKVIIFTLYEVLPLLSKNESINGIGNH